MLGFLALLIVAEVAIVDQVPPGWRWVFVPVFGAVAILVIVPNRLLDNSDDEDTRRAEILGDIAFLRAAPIMEAASTPARGRLVWSWRSKVQNSQ